VTFSVTCSVTCSLPDSLDRFWLSRSCSTEINEYTNAWDFSATDFDAGKYNMRFWYNATGRFPGNGQAPTFIVRVQAAINSATNAFLRRSIGGTSLARFIGTMAMPKPSSKLELDIASLIGVLFYTWMLQLLLPVMLSTLVSEKENRLRSMMKMHGLGGTLGCSTLALLLLA
jgi:hypothetical protein